MFKKKYQEYSMLTPREVKKLMGYNDSDVVVDGVTWKLDTELSNNRSKVYYKLENGKHVVYIMHGGTDSVADWYNNLFIPFEKYYKLPRYLEAERVQTAAIDKYGDPINTLSHSQGGKIVVGLIKKKLANGINITFNPAIKVRPTSGNLIVIKSLGDPVAFRVKADIIIEEDPMLNSLGRFKQKIYRHTREFLVGIDKLPKMESETLAARKFPFRVSAKTRRVCRRIGSALNWTKKM